MKRVSVPFGNTNLIGDIAGPDEHPSVLFLHGAGTADRTRFNGIRKLFLDAGISSAAFDYIGHGETGGDSQKTSLKERVEAAHAFIKALGLTEPLTIIGASMSGYIGIKLTQVVDIDALIFLAPGVYTTEAYDVPFGGGFSEIIRVPESWQNTDAWKILESYKGKLLIFEAEHDQVVPQALTQKLYDSANNASWKKVVVVPDATHPLGKYLEENPKDLQNAFDQMREVL